jgi:predicted glycosyltransferase
MGWNSELKQLEEFVAVLRGGVKKKIVITICNISHVRKLKRIFDKLKTFNVDIVVVCLDMFVVPLLEKLKIPFRNIEDYTTITQLYSLNEIALQWANNWYKNNNSDFTIFEGISLGSLIQWKMSYYFSNVFLCIEQMKMLWDKEKPDLIIMIENRTRRINSILVKKNEYLYSRVARNLFCDKKLVCICPSLLDRIYSFIKMLYECKVIYITIKRFKFSFFVPQWLVKNLKSVKNCFIRKLYNLWNFFPMSAIQQKRCKKLNNNNNNNNNISIPPQFAGSPLEVELLHTDNNVIILNGTPSLKDFKKGCPRYLNLKKYKKGVARIKNEEMLKIFYKLPFKRELIYGGMPVWNIVKDRFFYIFREKFPQLMKDIYALKQMLSKERIHYIVSYGNTTETQKALLLVGKKMHIPSLFVQPGHVGYPISCLPVYSDDIAVYGEVYKDWFRNNTIASHQIFITGPFNFDNLLKKESVKKEAFFRKFNLNTDKKLIVLALERYSKHSYFPGVHLSLKSQIEYIMATIETMKNFPQCQLIVKFHPSDENFDFIKRFILKRNKSLNESCFIIRADQNKLLTLCEILITRISTIGLKAMALGKKVIILNFNRIPRTIPLENNRLVFGVYRKEDLRFAIKRFMEDSEINKISDEVKKRIVNKYVYIDGKNPSKKIVEIIQEKLNRTQRLNEDCQDYTKIRY